MAHRLLPIMLVSTAAAVTACGAGAERAQPVRGTAPAEVAAAGFTSAQLGQALLTEVPGHRRAGEPDSGEYGTLAAIQNSARVQREAVLDKPRCGTGRPGSDVPADAPAALVTFARQGQTVTETLIGMSAADAEKQVNARVPAGCLRFRTKVGAHWAEHRVVESPRGDIGAGSRTVGVATAAGAGRARTWYVVFRDRDYIGTITLFGPSATRADAENLARASLAQARRILS
ncbi:hypothetical protein [Actinomadura decatromicini]|uniref:Sensor domain-containing protein n=1 Tax=Actinomadura decatromicini TaxID=2604572 RepID=A0A5D3FQV5_9ACTN|nr:hypothetical protein [Actinomadura decatromicini]TYK50422.1 hypothetical protein FXF68_07760 [Actinomadura decatromicini]